MTQSSRDLFLPPWIMSSRRRVLAARLSTVSQSKIVYVWPGKQASLACSSVISQSLVNGKHAPWIHAHRIQRMWRWQWLITVCLVHRPGESVMSPGFTVLLVSCTHRIGYRLLLGVSSWARKKEREILPCILGHRILVKHIVNQPESESRVDNRPHHRTLNPSIKARTESYATIRPPKLTVTKFSSVLVYSNFDSFFLLTLNKIFHEKKKI